MSNATMTVAVSVQAVNVSASVSGTSHTINVGMETGSISLPIYTGEYEITPSNASQTLLTAGHTVLQDVIINPVPSNYGLITYNGSTITVS